MCVLSPIFREDKMAKKKVTKKVVPKAHALVTEFITATGTSKAVLNQANFLASQKDTHSVSIQAAVHLPGLNMHEVQAYIKVERYEPL